MFVKIVAIKPKARKKKHLKRITNMTLESQVTSLELSKKLKELGVKQESLFYWKMHVHPLTGEELGANLIYRDDGTDYDREISAFTVAELGGILPPGLWYERTAAANRYRIGHIKELGSGISPSHVEYADTEADARAKILIYLIEDKLITL